MQVKDVMTADVTTTTVETPLRQAAELLVTRRISGMPVVCADGSVLGVLSEADVLAKERRVKDDERSALARVLRRGTPQDAKHEARLVGDAMTAPAITIPPYVSLATAAGRMLEHGVNRLPVTQRGKLIGIVTRADLVRAFVRTDEEIAAEARDQVAFQQALVGDANVVEVAVENGDAVLTGAVRQHSDADVLPSLVRQVPGVVRVRSELSWSEED